ncbi:MAG: hypothetical protein FD155_2792 [Bacteroidetes bacterium]|nr:MAG: hypothetical protein FD155_2792 [Bacteroidota bacterium]
MNAKNQNSSRIDTSSQRVYKLLGIRMLNKFIMATIGKAVLKVNPKEKMPSYFIGHPFEIDSLILTKKWLLFNEVVHFALIILCAAIGYFFYTKGYFSGVFIIALVIVLNFSLMFMQRMNRNRIKKTISGLEKRRSNSK